MAERRRISSEKNELRRTRAYGQNYVSGTAAVEPLVVPERPQRKRRRQEKRETSVQQGSVKMLVMSGMSLVFVVGLAIIVSLFAVSMIRKQAEIRKTRNEIKVLRAENEETKRVVQDEIRSINDDVDLSKVYKTATKKLGMKSPTSNKKYSYSYEKSDVIKQYADIPDSK